MAARSADALPDGIERFRDTCNVYVVRSGREAILVDFGSGAVLDRLGDLGVDRVTDVLLTHHHRDQLQGLRRAVDEGIRVWAPPEELHLIAGADELWRRRELDNDYDLRQDRFSLLEQVPVTGTVAEYRTRSYGPVEAYALPTPGHTVGSVTYLLDHGGSRVAFTGDLVYGDGRAWSLAATQWTYGGVEGQVATIVSCGVLADRRPDLLLPSHGEPIHDPGAALARLSARLRELVDLRRGTPWDVEDWWRKPWREVTPHLLRCRTSFGNSYALLSESGAALLIDWGYDVAPLGGGLVSGRGPRRPLLTSLDALRRDHGVDRVEAVVTTHFHDDHVAGVNLLREVEGTEVWAPENVAPVLEEPRRYDLPCLWFDPIPVDRRLPLGETVAWREYELSAHALPGHTLYAAGILFEVDGRRVLAAGDQLAEEEAQPVPNYQYRNRFRVHDYVEGAELYARLAPDLVISGHWLPRAVTPSYLERIRRDGERVAALHRDLLPDDLDLRAEGFGARIEPYRPTVRAGEELALDVHVVNPFDRAETAHVVLAAPDGWSGAEGSVELEPRGEGVVRLRLHPQGPATRARVAADLTVGGVRFGQQAEAVVEVR
ncbi:MAG TPA: MBL fold metallo-hydrolase [Gaiellaceae bacterium]|nr:MBL fold metallo-hydrolase [Gaiellaceae bacterium]